MVQKSGYFARSAAPNGQDRALIKDCAVKAVECAFKVNTSPPHCLLTLSLLPPPLSHLWSTHHFFFPDVLRPTQGEGGVIGHDENTDTLELRACEFKRIAGGKPFDVQEAWYKSMLKEIGQPFTAVVAHEHA
jgi:pyrophosphate--fructose-6-phosphate 1-phosphotransferase